VRRSHGFALIRNALESRKPSLGRRRRVGGCDSAALTCPPKRGNSILNLTVGLFGTFRNPTAHEARIRWPLTEADALDLFVCAMPKLPVGDDALRTDESLLVFGQSVQLLDNLVHLSLGGVDRELQLDDLGVKIADLSAQRFAHG